MKKSPSQCAQPAEISAFNDGLMGQILIRTFPKTAAPDARPRHLGSTR
jgi:hypothetical protein